MELQTSIEAAIEASADYFREPVTPEEASRSLPIHGGAATIRKWAQLKKIEPAGLDKNGRKLYRRIDIIRYEYQTRHRAGRAAVILPVAS